MATYQNGSPTTIIGPPTSGGRILNEFWRDALGGEWVCTAAGTPGTWIQIRPAAVTTGPSTGTIPTDYFIWNVTDGAVKRHAGSYSWEITVGADASAKVGFHGTTPTAQAAHIPDPSGGSTVDAEARAAIGAILVALEGKGFVAGGGGEVLTSRSGCEQGGLDAGGWLCEWSHVLNTNAPYNSPMSNTCVFFLRAAAASVLTLGAVAQHQLQPLWQLDPGSRPYLTTDNTTRGLAYNPTTGNVLVVSRAGGLSVSILDGTTGADRGGLNVTGIAGGTLALSQIAVAGDGAIYAANLVSSSSDATPFKIYRWANEQAAPTVVYVGAPAGDTRGATTFRSAGRATPPRFSLARAAQTWATASASSRLPTTGSPFSPPR